MKRQKYELLQKDDNKIAFSRRTLGADAAIRRRNFDRNTTTPLIDDPRQIIAFILTAKSDGYVVAGRLIVTTVIASQVATFDLSEHKEVKIILNKELETLKAAAEQKGP